MPPQRLAKQTDSSTTLEEQLVDTVMRLSQDPLGYVLFAFPWGSDELPSTGPRAWQRELLEEWGAHIKDQNYNPEDPNPAKPWMCSVVSGHGSGKTAFTAWIVKFLHDTRPFSKGSVTAASMEQLRTKTWAEVGKWHNLSITKDWSEFTTGQQMTLKSKEHGMAWACTAYKPSKENFEAFQGQHADRSSSYYIFDEASGLPDKFYEVARGGMATGEPHMWAFGNGTRASGFFYRSHMDPVFRENWVRRNIDVRKIEGVSPHMWKGFLDEFGEDSDVFRVRVAGKFPELAEYQFIPTSAVETAQNIESVYDRNTPLVMGVDVARGGGDRSVIWLRRGQNARDPLDDAGMYIPRPVRSWSKNDTSLLEDEIHELAARYNIRRIYIETHGMGGPVIDHLKRKGIPGIHPVNLQTNWSRGGKYHDRKTAMLAEMRERMMEGRLAIPKAAPQDEDARERVADVGANLVEELLAIEASMTGAGFLKIAPPARGVRHPDFAYALGLTFAEPDVGDHWMTPDHLTSSRAKYDPHKAISSLDRRWTRQVFHRR